VAENPSDREILEYRDLIEVPDRFESGVSIRTALGAFFIGMVMMPGAIYLGLLTGGGLGGAAQWVTIILFTEAARRAFTTVSKQELYMIYYIAGSLTGMIGGLALSGGPFAWLIWNQYFIQSPAAASFADQIPAWVAPKVGSDALVRRTFLQSAWVVPIGILVITNILSRVNWFSAAYVLFRISSDLERLPFPMAPVAVQGATALAESSQKTETWRWQVFSIGTMIGLSFGAIYVAIPALTSVALVKPIHILPIPWIDFTTGTESILPAVPFALATDLSAILVGFILPFWVVIGGFIGVALTATVNPILRHFMVLDQWRPGMGLVDTVYANQLDFWMSFGIGIGVAIGAIGIIGTVQANMRGRRKKAHGRQWRDVPKGRGDFNIYGMLALFGASTLIYVLVCAKLVPGFNVIYFVLFGFVWTPLMSYVAARMCGMSGQFFGIPMVREATFILSGYKGVDIWFAPIPQFNHGQMAQSFREVELVGASFRGLLKAELLAFPILLVFSFIFWEFIWRMSAIPSAQFPYALEFWPLSARQSALFITGTSENPELFLQAINLKYISIGLVGGLVIYYGLGILGLPTLILYGMVRSLGGLPHTIFPEVFGALLGRYYFARRFGLKRWRDYAPVVFAGYACGMGLTSMIAIAIVLIAKSVRQTPF